MKRFFKYLFLLQAAVLLTAACGKSAEEEFPGNKGSLEKTFRASMPSTKVAVDGNHRAIWEAGDDISVEGSRFTLESPGSASAVFRGTVTEDKDNYLAMLPWTDAYVFGERTVSGTLPNRQPANEGGCACPLAYGWSVGSSITFHHLTTVLQFTLGSDMTDVREIVLRGNDGETLAGDFSLALDSGGAFSSFAEGPTVYESVALTGTLEANKTYCFNVLGLGTEFASGLTLEFLFADGTSAYITKSEPITLKKGEWVNLSDGITKGSLTTPMSKGIASTLDWENFKAEYDAMGILDPWMWNGEILLMDNITLDAGLALSTLDIPLNGNGHTITYTGTASLIGTLSADVHDLGLAGSIDFAGNGAVGALASTVSTGVTVSNVNSRVNITAGALGMTDALMIGGLAGTVSEASGRVTFDNCTVTGTIKSLNYAHSVGGILAHGGSGSAPESVFEGCTFNGKITYAQGSCPFDFRDGYNKDRTAGRVGGIIGDASRVSVLRDCSTGDACKMDIRLHGMTLGNGGVGGLVGRTTGEVGGYTMSVTLEGTNTNNAAITVHDAKAEQHSRFGQVVGSVIKATVGSGTESGSLTFVDTPAPSTTTTGHFRLCQVAPRHTVSIKYSLDGTRSSTTQHYMSYLIVTTNNKVIVVDGGWAGDAPYLESLIKSFGGHVDAWFISHPHEDHISALSDILYNKPEGITIGTIYHTKASSSMSNDVVNTLYSRMEAFDCDIVDIREPGGRYDIDGVGIKVLSVSDEVLNSSNLNDSSLALRIWDENKSVVLLGDCMVAEGRKLLATCQSEDLDCDFLQLGHHGNKGPEKAFYDAVSFRYALVPTAEWIWHPELYYNSTPSNLDGGATRGWIEAKRPVVPALTSYDNGDVWIDEYGKITPSAGFSGSTIDGFGSGDTDYFN